MPEKNGFKMVLMAVIPLTVGILLTMISYLMSEPKKNSQDIDKLQDAVKTLTVQATVNIAEIKVRQVDIKEDMKDIAETVKKLDAKVESKIDTVNTNLKLILQKLDE